MQLIRIKQGYDLLLRGDAAATVSAARAPETVAVKPPEYRGIKARRLVDPGDRVKIGTPLFYDKAREDYRFASPASGTVTAVNRGERRVITSIVIARDGEAAVADEARWEASDLAGLAREELVARLLKCGLLGLFTQRPFGNVADPTAVPRDIFVSTFDSGPLGPDLTRVVAGREDAFQAGIRLAAKLTSGQVHLGIDGARGDLPAVFKDPEGARVHAFAGPHPSGNVGVQIHHIAPIRGRHDVVWTITVQGLIWLGELITQGQMDPATVVAVTGSNAREPRYLKTVAGAPLGSLAEATAADSRWIAGNVLTGRHEGPDGFLGLRDHQVTIIPEAQTPLFLAWAGPGLGYPSQSHTFLSRWLGRRLAPDTRLFGGRRAIVVSGWYERVLPMNILASILVKSILAEDFEEMEGLGIYELLEEDVALCEYICPSKTAVQAILRQGLDLLETEG